MAFEFSIAPPNSRIEHPLNIADPYDESDGFRKRSSTICRQYLAGRPIFIRTAALKGPLSTPWQSPWLLDSGPCKKPKPNHHADAQSKSSKNTKSSRHSRSDAPTKQIIAKDKPDLNSRDTKTLTEQYRDNPTRRGESGVKQAGKRPANTHYNPSTNGHRNKEGREEPAQIRLQSPSHKEIVKQNTREPAQTLPSQDRFPHGLQSSGDDDLRRNESGSLLTPSASQPQTPDKLSPKALDLPPPPADKCLNQAMSADESDLKDKTTKVSTPSSLRLVTGTLPGLSEHYQPVKCNDNVGPIIEHKRACSCCKSKESSQWRKGPQGPRTLCASCGAKWTHQQKKLKKEKNHNRQGSTAYIVPTQIHQVTDEIRSQPGVLSEFNMPRPIKTRAACSASCQSSASHRNICNDMFPNVKIRRAVLMNKGTELEQLLSAEVLSLRGFPSPTMESWNKGNTAESQLFDRADEVMKPRPMASPKRSRTKALQEYKQDTTLSQSHTIKPQKRKVMTFDTPQNQCNMIVTRSQRRAMGNEFSNEENSGPSPRLPLGGRIAEVNNENEENPQYSMKNKTVRNVHNASLDGRHGSQLDNAVGTHGKSNRDTTEEFSRVGVHQETTGAHDTRFSTQAALHQAQEAFQGHVNFCTPSRKDDKTPLRTFSTTPVYFTRSQKHLDSHKACSTDLPIHTQDLFNQTLRFNSSSPYEGALSCNEKQGFRNTLTSQRSADHDLSAIATSQPEFDTAREGSALEHFSPVSANSIRGIPQAQVDDPTDPRILPFHNVPPMVDHLPPAGEDRGQDIFTGFSQTVDMDEVMRDAGCFLDTWTTE